MFYVSLPNLLIQRPKSGGTKTRWVWVRYDVMQESSMFDISLQELLIRVLSGLVIVAVHGYIQAWIAFRLGDSNSKEEGQITLNPMTHLSWLGFISYVIFLKGWGKPIRLDLERFPKRSNLVWVAFSGWLGLLGLALIALSLRPLVLNSFSGDVGFTLVNFLSLLASGSLWFLLWSLIPLPPLSGFAFLAVIQPKICAPAFRYVVAFEVALLLIAASDWIEGVLRPLQGWILRLLGGG